MRWLVVILVMGCAPPEPGPAPKHTVALFDHDGAPYHDGQDVTLVAGAQGGYHVWLAYQMTPPQGMTGELTLSRLAYRVSDEALVLRFETTIDDNPSPLPMFMCPVPVGLPVLDQPIRYELHFSDGSGQIAEGAVTLVPHCPADSVEVCQRICSG
jgi:hypothetical protein